MTSDRNDSIRILSHWDSCLPDMPASFWKSSYAKLLARSIYGHGCTSFVAKTTALISFAVTAELICVFVFAYAKSWFCHDVAHIENRNIRVLTHQKPPRRFCMLFFEVLPLTTLASSVNGKTSKKSVPKRRGGVWCV